METAVRLFAPRRWCIVFLAVALPSCVAESGCPSPDRGGSAPPARIFSLLPAATGIPERGEALRDRFDARLRQVRDGTRRLPRRSLVMIE